MPDLDEALAHVRRDLRAEAAQLADTDATLAAIRSGTVRYSRPPSNTGRYLAFAAAAIMVVGGLVAISWVTSDEADPSGPTPSLVPPPTATAPATVVPTVAPPITNPGTTPATIPSTTTNSTTTSSTTPAAPVVPVQVGSTIDSFFVDASNGWLTTSTSDGTLQTLHTVDGGATWVTATSLPAGIVAVRFADSTNGWAYDGTGLYSTHDGGTTWTAMSGFGGQVGDGESQTLGIAIAGNSLYVPVARDSGGFGLDSFGVTDDTVTQLDVTLQFGAGPVADLWVAAQPGAVWMIYNDRTVTGSACILDDVVDPSWLPPAYDQGGGVSVRADPTGGPLWALAQTGIWAGDMANPRRILYVSDDGGDTFRDVTPPGLGDQTTPFDISIAGPSGIVVSTPWGDTGTTLLHSTDEGVTWTEIANVNGVNMNAIQFVTPSIAIATVNVITDGHQELWRTDDGGVTWRPLAIGTI